MNELKDSDWPGNVRELENVIERAVISSPGPMLLVRRDFIQGGPERTVDSFGSLVPLDEMERAYILRVMEHTEWQIADSGGAAEILCLHPNTLRSRTAKLASVEGPEQHASGESLLEWAGPLGQKYACRQENLTRCLFEGHRVS